MINNGTEMPSLEENVFSSMLMTPIRNKNQTAINNGDTGALFNFNNKIYFKK